MFLHRVTVGHAGDVAAYDAVQTRPARLPAGLLADSGKVIHSVTIDSTCPKLAITA